MKSEDLDDELPFHPAKKEIGQQQISSSWRSISRQLGVPSSRPGKTTSWRMAAVLVTCTCLLAGGFLVFPRYRTIQTAYGEIKKVYLPDSTLVVLNSNSRLKYPANWKESERFVHLQGEAFFEVAKKPAAGTKFTVHTRLLDVEVLGTIFNVNAGISGRTEVSLNEGKVLVKTKMELQDSAGEINMEPGEVVIVEGDSYRKTKDDEVRQRSAWINNDFYFDSTPLSEVAAMIERKYGYHVRFKHDSLSNLRLSGNMHAENFTQFEKALEITMKMDLTLRSDTLFVGQAAHRPGAENNQ